MSFLYRARNILRKLLSGEDVITIVHNVNEWDAQYTDGRWERLKQEQKNTKAIATHICEEAQKNPTLRVLDVGCGNGGLTQLIHSCVGTYVGTDISSVALEEARLIAPKVALHVCDAANPPSDLGIFDVIVFNEILYYTNPEIVLRAHQQYAHTDTTIIISIVRHWRSLFLWRKIFRLVEKRASYKIFEERKKKTMIWDIVIVRFRL